MTSTVDPAAVAELAGRVGFASLWVLPVDNAFWRFYELAD